MAYHYEQERHGNDPYDPHSRSGLRPHEFPSRGENAMGGLALGVVLLIVVGLFVLVSAFGGGNAGLEDTTAPTAATAPAADTAAPAATTAAEATPVAPPAD